MLLEATVFDEGENASRVSVTISSTCNSLDTDFCSSSLTVGKFNGDSVVVETCPICGPSATEDFAGDNSAAFIHSQSPPFSCPLLSYEDSLSFEVSSATEGSKELCCSCSPMDEAPPEVSKCSWLKFECSSPHMVTEDTTVASLSTPWWLVFVSVIFSLASGLLVVAVLSSSSGSVAIWAAPYKEHSCKDSL